MPTLKTALLATFTVLASTLAAQATQAAAHTQRAVAHRAASQAMPRPRAASGPAGAPAGSVPASQAATDPSATRWRATIDRRLSALARSVGVDAATPAGPLPPRDTALRTQLQRLASHASQFADVGVAVRDLETGAPLFAFHANHSLNPASNHKLLTAIAAVELLGADYRFRTSVLVDGDTLVLVGDGDPSFQVEDLEALVARTVQAGTDLSRVTRIVADDTAFTTRSFGPGYDRDGPGWSYLAPSGALSLQFNTITVKVRPGRPGQPAHVSVSPPSAHVVVENDARTGRRDRVSVQTYARGTTTVVAVSGTVRSTVRARRRIVDPAHFTASTFAAVLAAHTGAAPLPVTRGVASPSAHPLAHHDSAPLPQVLGAALVFSNNFTSEQVLRTLGRRMSASAGGWVNGRIALERFWSAIGRSPDELTFENASGYSRSGRLTADAIVALLALTQRPERPASALARVLPASGKQGTMRHRLPGAHGRVRAKTGTLAGASALSGTVVSRTGGRALGFSILVNGSLPGHSSRRLQDRMVMALVQHLD